MTAYYNEFDQFAAEWLRELIKEGHIAPGVVDTRSIEDVSPADLAGFTQCHFFAGIGVWSHALRAAGWPDDRKVWTGSCPCQPFSAAGKGNGFADERHLWPAFFHLIRVRRPGVVFGEQVASKDGLAWIDLVHADMEGEGYAVGAVDSCAAGFGAPHIRQRLYWVGHAIGEGLEGHGWHGHNWGQPGRVGTVARGSTSEAGSLVRLANTELLRCDTRDAGNAGKAKGPGCSRRDEHARYSCAGGLADAEGGGRREKQQDDGRRDAGNGEGKTLLLAGNSSHHRSRPTNGHWRDADWLLCRDGKWRPVEPGTFPLVAGAPNRVGRLRGYGNAIVAPQAQAFIEAYMAVKRKTQAG